MSPEPPEDRLAMIQRLYLKLTAMPFHVGSKRESPEFKALVKEIRAAADLWRAAHPEEMINIILCQRSPSTKKEK